MKDYLAELVRRSPSPLQMRNTVREYLQARILEALQRAGAMIPLAFHGGTALRLLFATSRYSEDLDFALEPFLSRINRLMDEYASSVYSPRHPTGSVTRPTSPASAAR